MEYSEIVGKIKTGKTVECYNIDGMQLIRLFLDQVLKNFEFDGVLYEINFIPVEYDSSKIFHELNDDNCFNFPAATNFLKGFVNSFENNVDIFIKFENNYYNIVLDILETRK